MKTLSAIVLVLFCGLQAAAQPYYGPPRQIGITDDVPVIMTDISHEDLNGDGRQDIVIGACFSSLCDSVYYCGTRNCGGSIGWYAQDSLGNFWLQPIIDDDSFFTWNLHVSDIDFDGDSDLIRCSTYRITWFENDGLGNFTSHEVLNNYPYNIRAMNIFDLDGDGDQDLVANRRDSNFIYSIIWMEFTDEAGFENQQVIEDSTSHSPRMHAADLDGDTDLDLVVVNGAEGSFYWYENEGGGIFNEYHHIPNDALVFDVFDLASGDLDGDGDQDLVCRRNSQNLMLIYENLGMHDFSGPTYVSLSNDGGQHAYIDDKSFTLLDVDLDNDLDIVSTSLTVWWDGAPGPNPVAVIYNDGQGNFSSRSYVYYPNSYNGAYSISAGDLSGDSLPDIIFAMESQFIGMMTQDPESGFNNVQVIRGLTGMIRDFHSGDLDADGDRDIIGNDILGGSVILRNDGLGSFNQIELTRRRLGTYIHKYADMDNDGDIDIVSEKENGSGISWIENEGDAQFAKEYLITDNPAQGFTVIDYDADGDKDVLTVDGDRIIAYLNFAGGSEIFLQQNVNSGIRPTATWYLEDVDDDGLDDFVRRHRDEEILSWHPNMGEYSFGEEMIIGELENSLFLELADLNGDGLNDFVASATSDEIYWFVNEGDEVFGQRELIGSYSSYFDRLFIDDVDGDGDLDILANTGTDDNRIAWFENNGQAQFAEHILDTTQNALITGVLDVDGDYCQDILGIGIDEAVMMWQEHLTECSPPDTSNTDTMATAIFEDQTIGLSIFPNPFSSHTNIRLFNYFNIELNLRLTELTGREVWSDFGINTPVYRLERHSIPRGIYLLSIYESRSSKLLSAQKLIIQ